MKFEFASTDSDGENLDVFIVVADRIESIAKDISYMYSESIYEIECDYCPYNKIECNGTCPTWTGATN